MATLNIKGFPDGLYRKLQQRARKDRRSLAQEITYLLQEAVEVTKLLPQEELRPFGRDFADPWEPRRQG